MRLNVESRLAVFVVNIGEACSIIFSKDNDTIKVIVLLISAAIFITYMCAIYIWQRSKLPYIVERRVALISSFLLWTPIQFALAKSEVQYNEYYFAPIAIISMTGAIGIMVSSLPISRLIRRS